jgi:uncharacterized membrane protein YqjE
MIHPLVRLAASRPELLAEHGEAYVALVGKELSQWRARLVRRAVMAVVAGVGMLLSVIFIGVALMLWGVTPESDIRALWALLAPPVLMVLVTAVAGFMAVKGGTHSSVYADIKAQISADLALLREVKAK